MSWDATGAGEVIGAELSSEEILKEKELKRRDKDGEEQKREDHEGFDAVLLLKEGVRVSVRPMDRGKCLVWDNYFHNVVQFALRMAYVLYFMVFEW